MDSFVNLDKVSASASQDFFFDGKYGVLKKNSKIKSKDVERLVTNALGVLQEEGVNALIIYLCSKRKAREPECSIANALIVNLVNVLGELKMSSITYPNELNSGNLEIGDILNHFSSVVASDIDNLFLTKRLYEQILIYSRYGAKAYSSLEEGAK